MRNSFTLNRYKAALVGLSVGLTVLTGTANLVASANESADSPNPKPAISEQPAPTPTEPNQQTEQKPSERSPQERNDDRVYISDVYPEYCRMYFHRRDYVSLFEYRETMYRCLYGPDRWR